MPDIGEVRRGKTETVQWDGSRWTPLAPPSQNVDNPKSFGLLDYVPGLRDILNLPSNIVKGVQALPDVARGAINEPLETAKGFVRGASEAATPGRVGLLALLTGGATLPATLAAGGGQALAEGARVATDAPNAPTSLGEGALDVAEAASLPGLAAAVNAIPDKRQAAARLLGAGFGGYEGYRYGGLPGMVAGAGAGAAAPDVLARGSRTMRALRTAAGFAVPEAEAAVSNEAPAIVDRFKPNRSAYTPVKPPIRSTVESPPFTEESPVDRFKPNVSTYEGSNLTDEAGRDLGVKADATRPLPSGTQARLQSRGVPQEQIDRMTSDQADAMMREPSMLGLEQAAGEAIPGLSVPQGTYTQLPSGDWAVQGKGLRAGGTVNVSTANGTQRMMTVNDIISDEDGHQIASVKPRD